MWIGTYRGLYLLDPATGGAKRYLPDPLRPRSLSYELVEDVHLDRRRFLEKAEEHLAWFARSGRPFTIALADVDNFKSVKSGGGGVGVPVPAARPPDHTAR